MDDLAALGDERALDQLVVPVDRQRLFFLVEHRAVEEGQEVLGVEARGVDGDAARQMALSSKRSTSESTPSRSMATVLTTGKPSSADSVSALI